MTTDSTISRLRPRSAQFQQAVRRLQEPCAQPENEFVRDLVIQRFEFCFELGWKMLRLKLLEEGVEANTPPRQHSGSRCGGLSR